MGYTMKGSPMQRNFGIGSPMKQDKDKGKRKSEAVPEGYRMMSAAKTDGTIQYWKVGGVSGEKTEISKSEYDEMMKYKRPK